MKKYAQIIYRVSLVSILLWCGGLLTWRMIQPKPADAQGANPTCVPLPRGNGVVATLCNGGLCEGQSPYGHGFGEKKGLKNWNTVQVCEPCKFGGGQCCHQACPPQSSPHLVFFAGSTCGDPLGDPYCQTDPYYPELYYTEFFLCIED